MGTKTQKLSNVVDQIVEWQSVFTGDGSTGLTTVAGRGYFIDTTSGTVTVTLPTDANSKLGDTIVIRDYAGTFATNNVTITSTAKISEADADGTLSTNDLVMTLTYVNSTKGWVTIENEAKSVGSIDPTFISATGGTITTSGDYKIHTFTGDGCFVVSSLGAGIPCAQASTVDYLVVAGGGASGGPSAISGGGGAGGFRASSTTYVIGCAPAAPLTACVSALSITTTTYPVTVGAGGPTTICSGSGSNSVFSTITSTGGGEGAGTNSQSGFAGGSGGGANGNNTAATGGAGNTPPVSPPQGNAGGDARTVPGCRGGGGGGGALAVGANGAAPYTGGDGGVGAGVPNDFGTSGENCGSYYYFSGGGGGGGQTIAPERGGVGGLGGGGDAADSALPTGENGTANTGGGGGGAGTPGATTGSGGKGIVIIRYKFQ